MRHRLLLVAVHPPPPVDDDTLAAPGAEVDSEPARLGPGTPMEPAIPPKIYGAVGRMLGAHKKTNTILLRIRYDSVTN